MNAASPRALPASLRAALDDPYAFGNHPDVPWKLPDVLPPIPDLRAGIAALEGGIQPVDRQLAATCLQKLAVGFNLVQTKDEARLRLEVWMEANGDLPADLWTAGTTELLRSYKFGMPKPPHLREVVEARYEERKRDLRRTREMLERAPEPRTPAEREPWDVRVKGMRDSFRKIGNIHKAAHYERLLAEHETREPEDWARAIEPVQEAKVERPPFKPSDSPSARRCAELAEQRRRPSETT